MKKVDLIKILVCIFAPHLDEVLLKVQILKESNLYEKTMIIFTSDHGMAFAGGKTTVYEGGLKVPFVVRNPYENKRGIKHKSLISHIDITPSLLDFAGALDHKKNRPTLWVEKQNEKKIKSGVPKDNLGNIHKLARGTNVDTGNPASAPAQGTTGDTATHHSPTHTNSGTPLEEGAHTTGSIQEKKVADMRTDTGNPAPAPT